LPYVVILLLVLPFYARGASQRDFFEKYMTSPVASLFFPVTFFSSTAPDDSDPTLPTAIWGYDFSLRYKPSPPAVLLFFGKLDLAHFYESIGCLVPCKNASFFLPPLFVAPVGVSLFPLVEKLVHLNTGAPFPHSLFSG